MKIEKSTSVGTDVSKIANKIMICPKCRTEMKRLISFNEGKWRCPKCGYESVYRRTWPK